MRVLIISVPLVFALSGILQAQTDNTNHPLPEITIEQKQPSSQDAEAKLSEAAILSEKGENEKAIALLEESIKINPSYSEAYYRLGIIHANLGQYDKVIEDFNNAVRIKPDFTSAYINLGAAYAYLKDYNQALKYLDTALSLDKENPKIYYNIGLILLVNKEGKKASYFLSRAKELSQKNNDALMIEKIRKLENPVK